MENCGNFIEIAGRIVSDYTFSHEIYGEGFYRFDLEVDRLSGQGDILPVTVSERLVEKAEMVIGQAVLIQGQVRSYNSYIEVEKRNRLVLTIFARDISVLNEMPEPVPNEVCLDGNLCKPAVYRTTPFGREISDMLVAVDRSYNKSDYIPCIAWGRNARYANRLEVGDKIRVWGRMQSRPYQKKLENGTVVDRVALEISVSKIEDVSDADANLDSENQAVNVGNLDKMLAEYEQADELTSED